MSRDSPQVKQCSFDEYQKLVPGHYFRNGFSEDISFKSEKLFKHNMQGKYSPYLGSIEMSTLCNFGKLFSWQSNAKTSLLTQCFCIFHKCRSFYNPWDVVLLKAYLSVQRFDIFCIFETYLKSSITKDDDSLRIPGYDSIRSDHPSNNKEVVLRFIKRIFYLWN